MKNAPKTGPGDARTVLLRMRRRASLEEPPLVIPVRRQGFSYQGAQRKGRWLTAFDDLLRQIRLQSGQWHQAAA